MEVKVEVSEDQLKELLDKEIKDLPKEIIQNILIECIKEYFSENDHRKINNIFIEEHNRYGYTTQPSHFFETILRDCDYSGLQEIVDNCIKDLKENYESLLIKIITYMIAESLSKTTNFKSSMNEAVYEILATKN